MADIKQVVVTKVIIDNKGAVGALKSQEKAQDDVTKSTEESEEATQEMTGALDGMASSLGLNVSAMKSSVSGIGKMVKGFKTLKGAIAATGIGLLIIALVSLSSWFTRTEEGGDELAKGMAFLKGAFEGVLDVLTDIGKLIFDEIIGGFKQAKQVFEVTAASFQQSLLKMELSLKKLFGSQKEVDKVQNELNKNTIRLAVAQTNLSVTIAANTKRTKENLEAIKESAASIKAKGDASLRLQEIENELNRTVRANTVAEAKRRNEIQKNLLITRDFNETFEVRQKALIEANALEKKQLEAEVSIAATRFRLAKERNAISASTSADLDAVAEAEANLINVRTASFARQRELLNRVTEQNNKQVAELKAIGAARLAEEATAKTIADAKTKRIDDAELKLVEAREKEKVRLAEDLIDVQAFEAQLLEVENARNERAIEAAKGHKEELLLIEFEHQTRVTKIKEDAAKKDKELKDAELDNTKFTAEQGTAITGSAISELGGLIKDNAVSSAVINIANGVTAALALGPAGLPLIPGIIAAGLGQLAIIKGVETVKAEKGMMIDGASHSMGGVNLMTPTGMIEAEGGEFIMNKVSTAMFKDELSAISQAGGGVPLAQRGMLIESANGAASIKNLGNEISSSVNKQQVVLVTEDLTTVQSRVAVTESISTL